MSATEQQVVAVCLRHPECIPECPLQPEDFGHEPFRHVFTAILAVYDRGEHVDRLTVQDELRRMGRLDAIGGAPFVENSVLRAFQTVVGFDEHCRIVGSEALRRRLASAGWDINAKAKSGEDVDALADYAERAVYKATQGARSETMRPLGAVVGETVRSIQDAIRNGTPPAIRTGLSRLDEKTTGMHPGDLWVVAGRPGMGKTSLALKVATSVAETLPVAFFSLEMTETGLSQRMLSMKASVDLKQIRAHVLDEYEQVRLSRAAAELAELQMHIDAKGGRTIRAIRRGCRRLSMRVGQLGLVVVDYVGKLRGPGDARQRIGDASQGCSELAKELMCPVMLLAQLNRGCESRADKRPRLDDLKESGDLEQDADLVLMVYRHEVYNPETSAVGEVELLVKKARMGDTGMVPVAFGKKFARFGNR